MIEPKECSYENFPAAEDHCEGMEILDLNHYSPYLIYHHDVPYKNADGVELHLQIIVPTIPDQPQKLPCIVFVQGSGWMKQNVYCNIANLSTFAARGYVIAVVEYRPTSVAPFPAQFIDAKAAVRFMRKNAECYSVDPGNIFIWGDSSGGHTALMVGITSGMKEFETEEESEVSSHVNAVIDFYGPTDILQMNERPSTSDHLSKSSPEGLLIGGKDLTRHKEDAERANPIHYLSAERETVPIMIVHGAKDRLVPFHQSVLLYEALHSMGKKTVFYKIPDADHGGPEFWNSRMFDLIQNFIEGCQAHEIWFRKL